LFCREAPFEPCNPDAAVGEIHVLPSEVTDRRGPQTMIGCNEGLEIAGIVKTKFSRPHNGQEAKPDQRASKELHR
jgi:hypothetical protein